MSAPKKTGKVYLVGAGPGDPGLLTVKAARLIAEADLIIYDYLVNPDHLRYARPGSVKLCVGKSFRHKKLSQDKINRMIVQSAKHGKTVLRLKGGDPYLFGRGAEEALVLCEKGIAFEVVPGVTSATACAAYSGIPLTHRDHNASVTFLTGHRAHDDNLDTIDWEKIIGLNGTIVIYMGFYNLEKICERLMEKGLSADTKIAVIQWGTLPRQKSCEGTLRSIVGQVRAAGLGAPAMIIVGDVVGLKNKLNWFEKLPLFGKKIVVTRSSGKNDFVRGRLESLGAEVFEFPLIATEKVKSFAEIDRAIRDIGDYDWIIFTSAAGVEAFLGRVVALKKDSKIFFKTKIAAVGRETAAALKHFGLSPDLQPERFEVAALAAAFKSRRMSLKGRRILLARTNIAPRVLDERLRALGARVQSLTVYKTVLPRGISAALKRAIADKRTDMITFTSSSTAEHFARIMGQKALKKVTKHTKLASIGPVTSSTLRRLGLKPACQAKIFTGEGLVDAIEHFYGGKR